MSAERNLYDLQMERYEIFKAQNPENGKFDVTFEIDGKAIHAHKSILCLISTTFDSMLSDRWLKQNETIKIEGFSFDSFKEFLTFIYSGECKLGNENIFVMIDLAEFYSIKVFKKYCENYLSKVELNLENIYQMIEIIYKYSLEQLKNPVIDFASKKIAGFMKSDKFYEIDKPILKEIIKSSNTINHQEELFEAVYKWAEKQTEESLKVENDLNFNETIKEYFSNFIPFIKFELMENGFFIDLVVEKSFLFTNDQLRKILWSRSKVQVRVINAIGKTMKGELQCGVEMKNVTDVIYSQKIFMVVVFHFVII